MNIGVVTFLWWRLEPIKMKEGCWGRFSWLKKVHLHSDSSSSNAILRTSVMNSDPNYVLYLQSMIILILQFYNE
uniref:Uncharacterized protein n=2 Tax=Helianthus annuus TaxID=4232 RepID=A0A251VL24_HELAN